MKNIAIVGAGMCGITCANYLFSKGFEVTIFEKSRGLGGRIATRRINSDLSVDHGAQYITTITPAFKKYLDLCVYEGFAEHWSPIGMDAKYLKQNEIFVGTPGMSNLLKLHAQKLNIKFSSRVETITRIDKKWLVSLENSEFKQLFDIVIFAIPSYQVKEIIPQEKVLVEELSAVVIDPCWSLILITKNTLSTNSYNRFYNNDISLIVYNASKPKRNKVSNSYIIHTSSEWTRRNLSLETHEAELKIINLLENQLNEKIETEYLKAHRWLYAQTKVTLGKSFLNSQDNTLFAGGDWCIGANVEAAFNSGLKIGKFVNSQFGL